MKPSITPRIAADGVLRHQPAVICHQGRAYPALALAAVMQGLGEENLVLQRGSGVVNRSGTEGAWGPCPIGSGGMARVEIVEKYDASDSKSDR
jgi:adenylate cyclase